MCHDNLSCRTCAQPPPPCSSLLLLLLQDRNIMDQIARYFGKIIPEVQCNDEDQFLQALNEAGLTDNV